MAAVAEETGGGSSGSGGSTAVTMIDETYEFSAPRFFDFLKGESDEDKRNAELWFDSSIFYAPSRMSLFLSLNFIIIEESKFYRLLFIRLRLLVFLVKFSPPLFCFD